MQAFSLLEIACAERALKFKGYSITRFFISGFVFFKRTGMEVHTKRTYKHLVMQRWNMFLMPECGNPNRIRSADAAAHTPPPPGSPHHPSPHLPRSDPMLFHPEGSLATPPASSKSRFTLRWRCLLWKNTQSKMCYWVQIYMYSGPMAPMLWVLTPPAWGKDLTPRKSHNAGSPSNPKPYSNRL